MESVHREVKECLDRHAGHWNARYRSKGYLEHPRATQLTLTKPTSVREGPTYHVGFEGFQSLIKSKSDNGERKEEPQG